MGPSANERRWDIERYISGTEVWSLNNAHRKFETFHGWARWYEVHDIDYLHAWGATQPGGMINYFKELNALAVPVYRSHPLPVIERQEHFPELDMANHFGGAVFWDGTPSRMLAHAVYEHDKGNEVEFIQSYGIDMLDPQHAPQVAAWSFWVGAAMSRGIEIGGTALARLMGPESDEGTRPLRVKTLKAFNAKPKGG